MSDIAKWALLVAGAIVIIGLIMSLPFMEFVNPSSFSSMVGTFLKMVGNAFTFGRGLINNFLHPYGRTALTGLLFWMFGKYAITMSVKSVIWVYHFIFK